MSWCQVLTLEISTTEGARCLLSGVFLDNLWRVAVLLSPAFMKTETFPSGMRCSPGTDSQLVTVDLHLAHQGLIFYANRSQDKEQVRLASPGMLAVEKH